MSATRGFWGHRRRETACLRHSPLLQPRRRPARAALRPFGRGRRHAAFWLALIVALTLAYAFRAEFGDVLAELLGGAMAGSDTMIERNATRARL